MSFQNQFQVKFLLFFAFLLFPILTLGQNPVSWSLESDAKGKTLKAEEKFKAFEEAGIAYTRDPSKIGEKVKEVTGW